MIHDVISNETIIKTIGSYKEMGEKRLSKM